MNKKQKCYSLIIIFLSTISCIYAKEIKNKTNKKQLTLANIAQLPGISKKFTYHIRTALNKSGKNKQELLKSLKNAPNQEERKAIAFLIAFMPERDLLTLSAKFLLKNVKWAYIAKNHFTWTESVPIDIFLNNVLPYAIVNETRDDWRADFYKKFSPLIKNAKTMKEAVHIINNQITKIVKVKYSTKRKKADQSPYESMSQGLASCTGLTILLIDAFRSVGIPARLAGTPRWTHKRGNHSWVEVYLNNKWYITEYYMDSKGLNHGWLIADAAKADPTKLKNKIYASSFKSTNYYFPLVWDSKIRFVYAIDVTQKYKDLWLSQQKEKIEDLKKLNDVAILVYDGKTKKRISINISIKQNNKIIIQGKTSSPIDDLNKMLTFQLKKNEKYIIEYTNSNGNIKKIPFIVNNKKELQKIIIKCVNTH